MPPSPDLDKMFEALTGDREADGRAEALKCLDDPALVADYLKRERAALLNRILAPGAAEGRDGISSPVGGLAMAREFSDLMDAVLTRIYSLACARVGTNPATLPLAIVATGGYGRRELSPFSDIDLTFIPQRDGDPQTDRVIREMFTQVMDICIARCGLELGYAYRLLEDCTNLDHQTACGLLDARLISGSSRLFIQFEDAYWNGFNPTDFIFTKLEEREKMLAKWGRTPRVVEPQLKEGPGGLRDLQTAVWMTQAKWLLAAARVRGSRSLDALEREAGVLPGDTALLASAKEKIVQVRNTLHALTNAERDQLVITRQEDVARLLGYREKESCADSTAPPVERFMADLYPAMAIVRRISEQVMRKVSNSRLILGIGLDCKRRQIVPANSSLEADDASWLLWMCEIAQKYALEFSDPLERSAVSLVAMRPTLADVQRASQVFTNILAAAGRVYPALQKMADLGILGWFLPEFEPLMDLIPYDPSHDHTVGQHTLFIVKHLEALLLPENEEFAEMKRILEELTHPEQLMLAVLLHDSGKAIPGRPHSETGEVLAAAVCKRLGWTEEATANVCFLVANHLVMAETSRLRDLNLEETLREFTQVVNDLDRLNMLYLLTYADTRAVGEGVWTQVKGRFLRELWQRAAAVLCDEEPVGYDDAAIARARRRLVKDLSLENLPEDEVSEHIQAMPPHYLLNQDLKQIALHIGFVRKVREGQPVVDFHGERDATYTELTVCSYDDPKPGLLAKIAGVLAASEVNVHGAQVMTRTSPTDRIALDTLLVDYRGRQLSPGKRREVASNLIAVLTGAQTVEEILKRRRNSASIGRKEKPESLADIHLTIRNDLSDTMTVLEIAGADTSGMFYRLCETFSRLGWGIHSARVSTWKGEARAGFYLTGCDGLSEDQARNAVMHALPKD